jgi:hypothetical protein
MILDETKCQRKDCVCKRSRNYVHPYDLMAGDIVVGSYKNFRVLKTEVVKSTYKFLQKSAGEGGTRIVKGFENRTLVHYEDRRGRKTSQSYHPSHTMEILSQIPERA